MSPVWFLYHTLTVHQPFESVMGKSRVKTRSSEQLVLPVDPEFLLIRDSSSEEDSERDDQSYTPPPPPGRPPLCSGLFFLSDSI